MDGLPVSWQHVPKQCCGQVPIPGMLFTLRALGGQANRAQNANGEEATTVVAPKVLRQVVRQSFRCGNCLAGHGRGLVVHHEVDEAPKQIGAVAPRPHHGQGFGDSSINFSTSSALFWLQGCQVKISLIPHVLVELVQGGILTHQVPWPQCLEDVVSHIPDTLSEGGK